MYREHEEGGREKENEIKRKVGEIKKKWAYPVGRESRVNSDKKYKKLHIRQLLGMEYKNNNTKFKLYEFRLKYY